ncbi:hypothetical protein [Pseudomonas cavernicola]|nr:hypothetical protein [Pseudomonas cavernicola]
MTGWALHGLQLLAAPAGRAAQLLFFTAASAGLCFVQLWPGNC